MLLYMAGFLSVVIYCCGLMIDLGMMEVAKVNLQNAADAAALGAVFASQDVSSMNAGAVADAKVNGYVNGVNGATVTVSSPPASGNFQNNTAAAKVVITQTFSTMFLPGHYTLTAQATALNPITPCVYLLAQYSTGVSLNAINQTITGSWPFFVGQTYYFNGGISSSGNQFLLHGDISSSSGSVTPTPIYGPAMGDPLVYVPTPGLSELHLHSV